MISLIALSALFYQSSAQTCKAITLSGGGSRGPYEAGVLWALANLSNPDQINWNVVSGISAGALNTFGFVQFPIGQELAMANYLINISQSLNGSSSVYVEWPFGLIDGLLFEPGLFNTKPLYETLEKFNRYGIHRNFSIGSTNLDTGLFETWNESVGASYIDAAISSASAPLVFPPHIFQGHAMADGGCIINTDVFSAITRCLEIALEENIIVDIIYDDISNILPNNITGFKTLEVFQRAYDIHSYDSSVWYTYNAKQAFPKVDYRYIIYPSKPMPGGIVIPLNFSKEVIDFEIQLGINDTIAILSSGKTGKTIIDELWEENRSKIIYP